MKSYSAHLTRELLGSSFVRSHLMVPFILLYKTILPFDSVGEILDRDSSIKSYERNIHECYPRNIQKSVDNWLFFLFPLFENRLAHRVEQIILLVLEII